MSTLVRVVLDLATGATAGITADGWLAAGTALGVCLMSAAAYGMRAWAHGVGEKIEDSSADMLRAMATVARQVYELDQQLDQTRVEVGRIQGALGMAALWGGEERRQASPAQRAPEVSPRPPRPIRGGR